jgi:hypothetical protein
MSRTRRTDLPQTTWASTALCADMPAEIFDAEGDQVRPRRRPARIALSPDSACDGRYRTRWTTRYGAPKLFRPRRIIVSSFASHVHRIQQIIDAAQHHGRRVAFVGRSMVRNMRITHELGYLKVPNGLIVDFKVLERLPDNHITLVCTGSQGEPMAALSRMANRDHVIRIDNGDTVQLASSLIPGNENAIYRVINDLTRWGATVVHHGNAKVHVSGHASAGELIHCDNITRPRGVIPVHGEWRHLRSNADLAITTGIDPSRVILAEDGVVLDLINHHAKVTGKVPAGYVYVYVDGTDAGSVTEASLEDRRTLATEGVITVVVIVDTDTGKLAEPPGFPGPRIPPRQGHLHLRRHRHTDRPANSRQLEQLISSDPCGPSRSPVALPEAGSYLDATRYSAIPRRERVGSLRSGR